MPTAIIADDEDLPRTELKRMLATHWPELEIVAECEHGADALEAMHQWRPDVAFLDIRMPGMSGLAVANAIKGRCQIVFTTAYDQYAFEAFGTGAIDYLLKPIMHERLAEAVHRLRQRLQQHLQEPSAAMQGTPDIAQLMAALDQRLQQHKAQAQERIRWISASVGETIKMFPIDQILFFTSDEKYTRVVCRDDEAHVRKPLKEIIDGLDPEEFWQIHRGTVVRASAILRAQRDELGKVSVQLRDCSEVLKVSQAYAWRFKPM